MQNRRNEFSLIYNLNGFDANIRSKDFILISLIHQSKLKFGEK